MRKPKLLPCPWCGATPAPEQAFPYSDTACWRVSCDGTGPDGCGVLPDTGWRDTKAEAIEAWNTRRSAVADERMK